jgi:hypothetical protein
VRERLDVAGRLGGRPSLEQLHISASAGATASTIGATERHYICHLADTVTVRVRPVGETQ